MKTRKSIRAVFALLLAAVLVCGSLPTATAYRSDGEVVTLSDGGTYALVDYMYEGDFEVYYVNSSGTRLTTAETDSTVGVSIRRVQESYFRDTAGYLYIPDTYRGYPVVRLEKVTAGNHYLGIRIPASVTEIVDPTFQNCPYLEWIEVDEANPNFYAVDGALYKGNRQKAEQTGLVCYPQSKRDESFTTCSDAQYIADKAFNGNPYLKTLTVAVGAKGMDVGTIRDCTALETLILGEGPLSLDFFSAFGCGNLRTVHFSEWFLDWYNSDMGGEQMADYLDRFSTSELTVCSAAQSRILEEAAQEAGFGYSVCSEHTFPQQDGSEPVDPDDPNAVIVSRDAAFWFTNYYQRDADGNYVTDANGMPVVIGYAVEGLLQRSTAAAARVSIPAYHLSLPVMEISNIDTAFDNLISVHIPATVQSIKPYAFLPGEKITEFTVDDDSPYFKSVNGVLYTADGKTLVAYPQAKTDTVFTIPQGTERLADSEYMRLSSNIRQLNIPATFTDGQIVKVLRAGLEMIRVAAENPAFHADASGVMYNKDQTTLLCYPTYGPQDYTLPMSVTSIAEKAIGGSMPRTLRIADGATVTPVGELSVSAYAAEPLCLHIPASVTTIRLIAKGKIYICSTTRASQAAAFAAVNGLDFYICNEDHSILREPTDDDPPAPMLNDGSILDCSFIYEPDEIGAERITGACVRGLLETPDEPFVLTVPAEYRGVPVLEVNITLPWAREHGAKVTKLELPATVRSVCSVYTRTTLIGTNAFANLAEITVDAANPYLCAVDDVLFDKAMTRLLLYPAAKTDATYAIPDGVTDVKEGVGESGYVFGTNTYLRHLTIPASFVCGGGGSDAYFNALLHLPALQSVTVDPANPTFASDENGVLYSADRTTLILYPRNAPAEIFTIPASVDRIMSNYSFLKPSHLRVVCVAEGAAQTPNGYIGTTGTLQYVHIPSSAQKIRLRINGDYQSICSDSADSAAAAYTQKNNIPFALCSEAHAEFTPVQPQDLFKFAFYYLTEKDENGAVRYTGVCITGLNDAPNEPFTLTIPATYYGLPVREIGFNTWTAAELADIVRIELPETVGTLEGIVWNVMPRCTSLQSITVAEDNPYFCAVDGVLFNKTMTELLWYPAAKTNASYAIPDGVRDVAYFESFSDNHWLRHLSIPESFTEFGTPASACFTGLYNLESFSVDPHNPEFSSDESGALYNANKTIVFVYPCAAEAEIFTIPASVRRFGFYQPTYAPRYLRVLCIADGVETAPSLPIRFGDSLQYVHIPSSVMTIDTNTYKLLPKSVAICSDKGQSAAARFAAEWGYKFLLCSNDHSTFSEPDKPDDPPAPLTEPLSMTVSDGTAKPGETVRVTVELTKNSGVIAALLRLHYDPSVLTLTDVQDGGLLENATFVAGKDLSAVPYTVLWDDSLTHTNHTAIGTLVTYTFRVSENAEAGTTQVVLTYDENSTYNVDLENVACAIENGNVSIITRVAGDVNGDGTLDLKDVVLLRRFLAGGWNITVQTECMDVNGDGVISLKDCTLLSRFLAGGWSVTLQ